MPRSSSTITCARGVIVIMIATVAALACKAGGARDAPPSLPDDDAAGITADSGDSGRDATAPVAPDAATPKTTLRIMTFNIKHAEIGGLEGLADVVRKEDPDIVGLQEVDVNAARSGKIDQPQKLAQLTGLTSAFHAAFDFSSGGSYGVALLSRFPILSSERIALTSSGEQRIMVVVDLQLPKGRTLQVGVAHMDLQAAARAAQAEEIVAKLGAKPMALVMGDFNAQPTEASVKTLTGTFVDTWAEIGVGPGYTIPPSPPTRRIDYVMLAKDWPKPTAARVPVTSASDHLPVVVDVSLPP